MPAFQPQVRKQYKFSQLHDPIIEGNGRRSIQAAPQRNQVRIFGRMERKSIIFKLIDLVVENFSDLSPRWFQTQPS